MTDPAYARGSGDSKDDLRAYARAYARHPGDSKDDLRAYVSRPRIRTLKPEVWADEKVGALSRDARLLFIGLITMADDDGRLRARPAMILGHCFPYDDVSPGRLSRWLGEIERQGLIRRYSAESVPYVCFPGWAKHQKVNRSRPSILPPPPGAPAPNPPANSSPPPAVDPPRPVTERSVNDHGTLTERVGLPPRARRIKDLDLGKEPPHTPPEGGLPVRPSSARKRDWESFERECERVGRVLCGDADAAQSTRAVRQAIERGATSVDDARAFLAQWWPDLLGRVS